MIQNEAAVSVFGGLVLQEVISMNKDRNLTVLLVEDDDIACEAVVRSFKKHAVPFPIIMAHDGLEALEIIRGEHATKKIDEPFVILLDLNMPRMNGFEFLQIMRADPSLSSNVVFVLTTSSNDSDRIRAYKSHYIAGYMVKSQVGLQYDKLAHLLLSYKDSVILP